MDKDLVCTSPSTLLSAKCTFSLISLKKRCKSISREKVSNLVLGQNDKPFCNTCTSDSESTLLEILITSEVPSLISLRPLGVSAVVWLLRLYPLRCRVPRAPRRLRERCPPLKKRIPRNP
ncbi:hypothetical protein XELAEV_18001680mg [Xenopus laevis]|uniref:Uncharacterized protein n=1 Tax=Xenopus laevis TaxID=8355 RepID=A0A974BP26_XENLA|nr:hypothetical protein XELAEV_18001680mg [Xenopus laevis]